MDERARRTTCGGFGRILADTLVILLRVRCVAWTLDDCPMASLHDNLADGYRVVDATVDRLAHRIRTLGVEYPCTLDRIAALSSVKARTPGKGAARALLDLADDHLQIVADIDTLRVTLALENDRESAALLDDLRGLHDARAVRLAAFADAVSASGDT